MNGFKTIVSSMLVRAIVVAWALMHTSASGETESRLETLLFLKAGRVHSASFHGNSVKVEPISPRNRHVASVSALPSGKTILVYDQQLTGSGVAVSYPSFEVAFLSRSTRPRLEFEAGISLSPDGETLAYVTRKKSGLALCCENLNTGGIRLVSGVSTMVMAPSWSPDGKMIAYFYSRDVQRLSVRVVDVVSGVGREVAGPSALTRYGCESREPPIWLAAGRKLIFEARYGDDPPGKYVYEADIEGATKPVRLTTGTPVSVSPGMDTLYIADGGVYALTLGAGVPKRTLLIEGPAGFPVISPSGTMIAYSKRGDLYCRILAKSSEVQVLKDWNGSSGTSLYWVQAPKTAASDSGDIDTNTLATD